MPLHRLARLNRTTVFLATVGVMLLAAFLPGWYGAVLIFAIVAALAGVLRTTWPVLTPQARALRLAVLALLVVIAFTKVT